MESASWRPGDVTRITCTRSTHLGKRVVLAERHVGLISDRPWWTLRLDDGSLTSEFEDSLTGDKLAPSWGWS